MPSGAISGDSAFAYASGLLIPVVDTTRPAGERNGNMTLGSLAASVNSLGWDAGPVSALSGITLSGGTLTVATQQWNSGSVAATGANLTLSGGTLAVSAAPSFTVLNAGTVVTGDAVITGGTVTGLPTPSAATDAATKAYVDASVQGLQVKPTAALATAAALPANTYSNGSSGVGATLTATANGLLTVDGVATTLGMVLLVKNEAASANNGLYVVTVAGASGAAYVLTRHTDMETASEFSGAFVPVGAGGAANANTLWLANPSRTVIVGTTAIPFTQLNSPYVPGTSGAGITYSGGTFTVEWNGGSVGAIDPSLTLSGGTLAVEASQLLRTVPFSFIGTLVGGQTYSICIPQAGTLLANGGSPKAYIPVNPTATQTFVLKTINSGTINTQGTISISTSGSITWPTFGAVPWSAGDTVQLANQGTADATFANACLSFQFKAG